MSRYKVITWHGEGKSVWYVVDSWADDQPKIVASSTKSRASMKAIAAQFNHRTEHATYTARGEK